MKRAEAIARLRKYETELKQLGVLRLYLFGSTARDEAQPGSDVDLFFDYEKGTLSLFQLMDIKDVTSEILGCNADITTRDSINKFYRPYIEPEAVSVF